MSYGNRCLDLARSRYTFTLNSEHGEWMGGATWRFTNPCNRQIDNKYQTAVVMLRSFRIGIQDDAINKLWAPPAPVVEVALDGLSMPNNMESHAPDKRFGLLGQSTIVGVADMKPFFTKYAGNNAGAAQYPIGYGSRNHGSVAECGRLVAGDVVNQDLVVTLRGGERNWQPDAFFKQNGPVLSAANPFPLKLFAPGFVPPEQVVVTRNWSLELEVQLLLNYNKDDNGLPE